MPKWIIINFCGNVYDYVKKLDTLRGNIYSPSVLIGIWRLLNTKAVNHVSRIYSWLNSITHYKLIVHNIIDKIISWVAQESKDIKTLKRDNSELGDVTAKSYSLYMMRAQSSRSIYVYPQSGYLLFKRNISNNSLNNDTYEKESSDLWTSMKSSNEEDKTVKRKPIRKTAPNLFVEISKRLKKFENNNIYYNLNKIIGDPFFLIACYENIKSKPGNMTKGIDNYTLDGLNGKWFIDLAKSLKDGSYQFKPARLVEIPKVNGKMRTLSITSPRDKIVQKAIAVILEVIYEPIFKDTSFGFRPNKSTHDALKVINLQGAGFSWVIQGDISKCFDNIPHNIIRDEINKKIGCPNFKALINKLIAYPVLNNNYIINNNIGTPQGTICSPIIANIVLHILDCYMEEYKSYFDKGKLKKHNPEYTKLQEKRKKAKLIGNHKEAIKYLVAMRKTTSFDPIDSSFRRLLYIRYADDFVVLCTCSYKECVEIRENIKNFLTNKCKLNLNLDKTAITSMKKHFNFLGASIVNNPTKDYVVYDKGIKTFKKAHIRTLIKAPLKELINNLIINGLLKRNHLGKVFPKGKTNLFNHPHYTIIKWYNAKILGILNYYSFSYNLPKISTIIWYLRASCALTLANKYKLKTMKKTFKKFGKNLVDPDTGIKLNIPNNFKVKNEYKIKNNNISLDNLEKQLNSDWASNMQQTSFGKVCCICNSNTNIEMHHIRKINNIRSAFKKNGYNSSMIISALNRKQIPLCKYHHKELHKGNLTYWEWRKIKDYK